MLRIKARNGEGVIYDYKGLEWVEGLNESFTLSFMALNTERNTGYDNLISEGVIAYEGHEFRIKQTLVKPTFTEVHAYSTFYDLGNQKNKEMYGGTHTFNEFATFAFTSTGWSYENVDVTGHYMIPNFGNTSPLKLILSLVDIYGCEYQILPGRKIRFAYKLGPSNMFQYRMGKNIQSIQSPTDSTNLKTVITGRGAEGLTVTYKSPNVALFGEYVAEDIENTDIAEQSAMVEFLKTQIQDYPDMKIELDVLELSERELGESVWLIHEQMGIEFKTRVIARKKAVKGGKLVTVSTTLGTKLPKSQYDVLSGMQQQILSNQNEYRSKIEQTNNNITLQVEQINQSISTLEITAGQIQSTVTQQGNTLIYQQSQITQNAGNIELRVKESDYNGNEIATRINMSTTTIDIQGSKINLIGAVTVLSDITGELGTITAGVINGVQINSANVNITEGIRIGGTIAMQSDNCYITFGTNSGNIAAYPGGLQLASPSGRLELLSANVSIGSQYGGTIDFNHMTGVNAENIKVGNATYADAAGSTTYAQTAGFAGLASDAQDSSYVRGMYFVINPTFVYIRDNNGTNLAQIRRES